MQQLILSEARQEAGFSLKATTERTMSREHSRRAVWLAMESEHGDRLVAITREHVSLAKELVLNRRRLSECDREIYTARIAQLRQERADIIHQFEEGA